MTNLAKMSFNNGEVTPQIDARSDVAKYDSSCRVMENWLPLVYGPAERRPGTKYINTGKNSPEDVRLISFIYSAEIAYMCEFGEGYARFYFDDVLLDGEVTTPYTTADLPQIQLKQIGDVLWLVHPSYATRKLTRTSPTTFSLDVIIFEKGPFLTRNDLLKSDGVGVGDGGGPVRKSGTEGVTMTPSVTSGSGTLTSTVETFQSGHVGALFALTHPRENVVTELDLTSDDSSTALDVKGSWTFNTSGTWDGTVLIQRNEDEAGWETFRTYIGPNRNITLTSTEESNNVQYRITMTDFVSAGGDSPKASITVNNSTQIGVVRIDSLVSGLVAKITVLSELASTDETKRWAEGTWSDVRGYPTAVAFFESRIVYGGTAGNAQTLWLSETDDYENFEAGVNDADSFSIVLLTTNDIRWIHSLDALMIGTSGSEWQVSSTKLNVPITPTNFAAHEQTTHGSKSLQAIRVNNSVLFVDYVGRKVRELTYNDAEVAYVAPDLSVLAEHITESGIVATAYQKAPTSTVWAVRADGTVLSLSYERQQKVVAWARHLIGETRTDTTTTTYWSKSTSDYVLTYFSESAIIWGVPIDYENQTTLGLSDDAIDIGGGIVALPCLKHPFRVGQTIFINGTTNYESNHVLVEGTTANELHIVDTFVAETFSDTTVVQRINMVGSGLGRMAQGPDGTLYFATDGEIIKVTNYGMTQDDTFFVPTGGWPGDLSQVLNVAVSSDGLYLYASYVIVNGATKTHVVKFLISDGSQEWNTLAGLGISTAPFGWDMKLAGDDSVYVATGWGEGDGITHVTADGVASEFGESAEIPSSARYAYSLAVDDDMEYQGEPGVVVVGGYQNANVEAGMYNLSIRNFADTGGASVALGGTFVGGGLTYSTTTIKTGGILTLNGYIYVLVSNQGFTTTTIYKLNPDLTIFSQIAGPPNAVRLFLSLEGNICVANQNIGDGQTDIFHFYDEGLTLLYSIDHFRFSMLSTWGQTVAASGRDWMRGDPAYWPGLLHDVQSTTATATDVGTATSVAVIPGDTEDQVWFVVLRTLNGEETRTIERMTVRKFADQASCFYVDCGVRYDGDPTLTITGLDHLEGELVSILGDGAVIKPQTVSNGAITLDEEVSKASVGIPFRSNLEPMRWDVTQGPTTTLGSIKKVPELVFSFLETLGVTYGKDADHLDIIHWRTDEVYGSPPNLFTGEKVVPFAGGYTIDDPLLISCIDPLPCTLRAIVARTEQTGR